MFGSNNKNTTPPAKCGYCGWLIGGLSSNLLEHKCFELFDEDKQLIHVNDCNIVTIVEKNESSVSQINNTEDYNECLISAVQARPPLYDHRIPVKDRTSLKKKALWKEILNVLGEKENDVEVIQKRWKQLRDCYVKAKRKENEYIPSGSAASCSKNVKTGFSYYNQMKFLDDVLGKSSTVTSLPEKININDNADDIESSLIEVSIQVALPETSNTSIGSEHSWGSSNTSSSPKEQQQKKKKSKTCDTSDVQKAILSALESKPVKKPDAVDGFLLQIGDRLRALPLRERAQFEIKILSLLFDLEQELSLG